MVATIIPNNMEQDLLVAALLILPRKALGGVFAQRSRRVAPEVDPFTNIVFVLLDLCNRHSSSSI